jgi:hypothetical protein
MWQSSKEREPVGDSGSHLAQRSFSALQISLISAENSSPGRHQDVLTPTLRSAGVFLWLKMRSKDLPISEWHSLNSAFCWLRQEETRDHQQQHSRHHTDIGDVKNRVNRAKKRFVNRGQRVRNEHIHHMST